VTPRGRVTKFGFTWGPIRVTRVSHVEGRGYVVSITADGTELEVYISPKGRSVRVFDKVSGIEWAPWPSGGARRPPR